MGGGKRPSLGGGLGGILLCLYIPTVLIIAVITIVCLGGGATRGGCCRVIRLVERGGISRCALGDCGNRLGCGLHRSKGACHFAITSARVF